MTTQKHIFVLGDLYRISTPFYRMQLLCTFFQREFFAQLFSLQQMRAPLCVARWQCNW